MRTIAAGISMALAVAFLSLGCGGQEEAAVTSGIQGQVLLGPTCPVVREGSPCPDRPFQATIDVRNPWTSEAVRTFTTDELGRFHVALAPSEYYIDPRPEAGRPLPRPIPQGVMVPPGRFVDITIEYDSGIR